MKNNKEESLGTPARGTKVISRFFLVSATFGFLIGLFEACLLWTTPRVIPLLVPDVGYVIWFLAPLVDMIFFGVVGLGIGWLASRTVRKEVPVAVEVGIIVTFVWVALTWLHSVIALQPFLFGEEVLFPLMCFAVGFVGSLVLLVVTWHRLAGLFERWMHVLRIPLALGLAAAALTAAVGIGVFVVRPSFSTIAAHAAPPASSGAPNIIFITLDTVRADHLSAYGYDRPTTPNLDRFARTGVLFENAIAAAPWTLASHASMFTGLLPQQHGADWAVPLSPGPSTLAEILRSHGYQTAGFVANQLYLQKGWGIAQGFQTYDDGSVCLRHDLSETLIGSAIIQPLYQHFDRFNYFDREDAQQLNERIFHWLARRPQRPFFAFINYFDVHDPYTAPGAYGGRFGKLTAVAAQRLVVFAHSQDRSIFLRSAKRDSLIAGYDNCLAYLDAQVGDLLKFLHHLPEWQNTIVIITSDHGEEFGGHGSYDHGRNLYRGVLHVPLIIAGPGVPQDVHISHIVATRQLFSTVLDMAGGGKTPFSRYSLAKFWNPHFEAKSSDNEIVSELVPVSDLDGRRAMMSLTTPQWQYIVYRSGRQELYQWTTDPQEKDNLAASMQDQAALEKLRTRLVGLVSNATGPWLGTDYLQALDNAGGPSRLNLLFPKPLVPSAADNLFRIGIAQSYFRSYPSSPNLSSHSGRDFVRSLPHK